MAAADPSILPIAVGFTIAVLAFALWVPWLIRESRRPVPIRVAAEHESRYSLPIAALCVRSHVVSLTNGRTNANLTEVAAVTWRVMFATALQERAAPEAIEPEATRSDEPHPEKKLPEKKGPEKKPKERPMPQQAWSKKRERQYEHIKAGVKRRGESEDTAEEIAARTVNKERARAGEAKRHSKLSVSDMSSGRRGGKRSHRGPGGRTKEQLYNEARRKKVKGRSKMSKAQLKRAVGR